MNSDNATLEQLCQNEEEAAITQIEGLGGFLVNKASTTNLASLEACAVGINRAIKALKVIRKAQEK